MSKEKKPYYFYNPAETVDYYSLKCSYWCDAECAYEALADTAQSSEDIRKYRALRRKAQANFLKYYHLKELYEAISKGIILE